MSCKGLAIQAYGLQVVFTAVSIVSTCIYDKFHLYMLQTRWLRALGSTAHEATSVRSAGVRDSASYEESGDGSAEQKAANRRPRTKQAGNVSAPKPSSYHPPKLKVKGLGRRNKVSPWSFRPSESYLRGRACGRRGQARLLSCGLRAAHKVGSEACSARDMPAGRCQALCGVAGGVEDSRRRLRNCTG